MTGVTYSGVNKTPPVWMGDFGGREHLIAAPMKLDASLFRKPDAVLVKLNGAAAQGATSMTVDALTGPVPAGTILRYAVDEYAKTTALAAAGATTVAVEALVNGIEDNDEAWYEGAATTLKSIPSGTPVGRTFTERGTSDLFGPAADTDDEFYLTAFEIANADLDPYFVAYRPGSLVKENYLPKWTDALTWTAGMKAKLRAVYQTITGVD